MSNPTFDPAQVHRYYSADCFNRCWSEIDKPNRTAAEDEQMLLLAMASLWHWTQRPDCTNQNRSVGCWQVARVYALLGQGENALRFGELSLSASADEAPFFLAYAHEAIARGAMVAGDKARMTRHLDQARALCLKVTDAESRSMLENDFQTIA